MYTKPTSQHYFEKHFSQSNIDWKKIFILPRVVTADKRIRVFQYKHCTAQFYADLVTFTEEILNGKLSFCIVKLLKKMLFKFGIVSQSLCSFCNSEEETPFHVFHNCTHTQNLWNQLHTYISENLIISCLTPHRTMFGFIDTQQEIAVIINICYLHLNLMFINHYLMFIKTITFLRLKPDIINIR